MMPNQLTCITLNGKPIPAKLKTNKQGKIYNARRLEMLPIKWRVKLQYRDKPYDGAVRVDYVFAFPIPSSWSKKAQANAEGMPYSQKPDIDNLQKLYNDCIKKIVIEDDAQIRIGTAQKIYSRDPRTEIRVYYD